MLVRRLAIFFFLFRVFPLAAQQFSIDGDMAEVKSGRVELAIYESDVPRLLHARIQDGHFAFSGSVDHPVAAEIRHPSLARPLLFILENSAIRIKVNLRHPETSPVSGSRSNSYYRLLLQQWSEQPVYNSPYASLVLLQMTDVAIVDHQFDLLQGEALLSPHYQILKHRVDRIRTAREDSALPLFHFTDSSGQTVAIDSVLSDSSYTILLFSSSYCHPCAVAERQVDSLASAGYPVVKLTFRLDDDPLAWDAEPFSLLAVDHIPFLLVVRPDRLIAYRDPAAWQLPRLLPATRQ